MRTVADILFGVSGQSVYFDAPEGRPSSITSVEVFHWDTGDDTAELTGSGTIETNPNTTLDAAAGTSLSDARNIPLTATTGITPGRTYLLTSATSLKEWVEVESVTAGDSVRVRNPLHNDYTSGDSFVSTRITANIDNTWAADETNLDETSGANPMYRVRWVYVVSGTTYVADTYFNLVRYGARHGVTPQDVESLFSGWLDGLPLDQRNDQGRRIIDEAYRAVKFDLAAIDLDDSAIAESELIDELVRYRALERSEWTQFMMTRSGDQSRHLASRAAYQERLDSFVRFASRAPVRDKDGAGARVINSGISVR